MSNAKKIFIGILLLAVVLGYWFLRMQMGVSKKIEIQSVVKQPKQILREYKNETYGFTFSYPEPYVIEEINPEQVFIGRKSVTSFEPLVFIYVIKNSPASQLQSSEEFVLDQSRLVCSSQTVTITTLCTRIDDVVKIAPFTSNAGAIGQTFYLKGEQTIQGKDQVTTIRRGPFYTFNSSGNTPNLMSFIMIGNPIGKTPEEADTKLIKTVASSLVISTPR